MMKCFIRLMLLANLLLGSVSLAQPVPGSCNDLLMLEPSAVALLAMTGDAADDRIPSPSGPSDAFPSDSLHCKFAAVQASPPVVVGCHRSVSSPLPTPKSHGSGQASARIDRPPNPLLRRATV